MLVLMESLKKAVKMYSAFIAENPNAKYTHQQCLEDLLSNGVVSSILVTF